MKRVVFLVAALVASPGAFAQWGSWGTSGGSGVPTRIDCGASNTFSIYDSAGNIEGQFLCGASDQNIVLRSQSTTTTGALKLASIAYPGSQEQRASGSTTMCVADQINATGASTNLVCVYGEGAIGVVVIQGVTIADNANGSTAANDTTSPTSSQVEITCNDANGCTYTPGETSVADGWFTSICNVSAANVVTLTEVAGTARVTGAATTVTLNTMDCARCTYTGTEWGCL